MTNKDFTGKEIIELKKLVNTEDEEEFSIGLMIFGFVFIIPFILGASLIGAINGFMILWDETLTQKNEKESYRRQLLRLRGGGIGWNNPIYKLNWITQKD